MACVLVPAAEAVVVTALYAAAKKREKKIEFKGDVKTDTVKEKSSRVSFSRKLSWLVGLLWGGVLLLVFEHIWHLPAVFDGNDEPRRHKGNAL